MTKRMSVETLRALLRLDAETGRVYRRASGAEALVCESRGYRVGQVAGVNLRRARVVFALVHGYWPPHDVDHRDGDRANDRPENLREATRSENLRNTRGKGGTSQFRGVSWDSAHGKWRVQIKGESGKNKYLGLFDSEEAAARAYNVSAEREHGAFARLNAV